MACGEDEALQRQNAVGIQRFPDAGGDTSQRRLTTGLGIGRPLEWVIDQYRVKTDKRSGIVNDPNLADDPRYIVKLIGKVIAVSLETVEIVEKLPDLGF